MKLPFSFFPTSLFTVREEKEKLLCIFHEHLCQSTLIVEEKEKKKKETEDRTQTAAIRRFSDRFFSFISLEQ